jgi:argininosuccinate synthase
MNGKFKNVVLAYSGGLDTSIIIPWLKENYGCRIIAMVADVGQQEDLDAVCAKALRTGACQVFLEDLREEFLTHYVCPSVKAGAIYEGKYLLGTSMARPIIAKRQVEIALREGADALAHGCTGKGNDQVRFELTYKALAPHLPIIAPWRIWDIKSREDALDYAAARGIDVVASRAKIYSRDRNIWHMSHEGGLLENPANEATEDIFVWTTSPYLAPDEPETVEIEFHEGMPIALDGAVLPIVELVERLNALGAKHGIGRVDMVENRFVGMKSRGVYETPGGTLLVLAHRELEALTLDRDISHLKEQLAIRYAELVYYGQWFTQTRQALDAFVNVTQECVTGSVTLKLYKGNATVVSRTSPHSLYREDLAMFSMESSYDQKDAEGFINLLGLPLTIQSNKNRHLLKTEEAMKV